MNISPLSFKSAFYIKGDQYEYTPDNKGYRTLNGVIEECKNIDPKNFFAWINYPKDGTLLITSPTLNETVRNGLKAGGVSFMENEDINIDMFKKDNTPGHIAVIGSGQLNRWLNTIA